MLVANNRVNRGEAILNQAVNSRKISECGAKAIIAAVDPFHDKPIDGLRGWPDHETAPSVVRHWKQSQTIQVPDEGSSILIQSNPVLNQIFMRPCARKNNIVTSIDPDDISTNFTLSPVTVHVYNNAASNNPLGLPATQTQTFAIPDDYFRDGPCRLIGLGIECHDVTAEIAKQGTVTLFEYPQAVSNTESVTVRAQTVDTIAYIQTPVDVCRLERFPASLSEMMSYPTSKQWAAKEGAYVVIPFTGHENPAQTAEYRTPWLDMTPSLAQDKPNALNVTTRGIGAWASGGANGDNFEFLANQYAPMNSRGIYFTGLNSASEITVTVSFFLESFPIQSSPLQSLAQPSCPFDPKALALISTIMQQMPVGVPVGENPLGEWFWEAVETALPVLGTAASAFFPEFTPLIAGAASAGTNYAAEQRKKAKAKRKKEKTKAALKNEVKQMVREDVKSIKR